MRLIDLLETAKKTQDIIIRDDWKWGIVYSKKFDCYVWCDKSGKIIDESVNDSRVTLSPDLLERDNWYLSPNQNERIEKIKEIHNKARKKSYVEKRAEDIYNEYNINKALEGYYNLGLAVAYGYVMYMLDEDFDKKDIKKVIMDVCKDDVQFRSDVYGVWGELMDKTR